MRLQALLASKVREEDFENRPLRVLVYFDGCRFYDYSHHYAFNQVLDGVRGRPIFTMFLDCPFQLEDRAPPVIIDGEERVTKAYHSPQHPPLTMLGFDLSPDNQPIVKVGKLSGEDVSKVEFLVKFGRP